VRTPFVKTIATIATLAGGGSAGKEGPISQIGSAIGSLFARYLNLGARARRTLFLAGMAGALGAIFRAPLGAALTSVEVLYKEDFESDAFIPCILASISGYFVFTNISGFDHLFSLSEYSFTNWAELIVYSALGFATYIFGLCRREHLRFVRQIWRGPEAAPAYLERTPKRKEYEAAQVFSQRSRKKRLCCSV